MAYYLVTEHTKGCPAGGLNTKKKLGERHWKAVWTYGNDVHYPFASAAAAAEKGAEIVANHGFAGFEVVEIDGPTHCDQILGMV